VGGIGITCASQAKILPTFRPLALSFPIFVSHCVLPFLSLPHSLSFSIFVPHCVPPFVSLPLPLSIYLPLLSDTELAVIEETFKTLTERTDIGILLINQTVRTRNAVDCTMLSTNCVIVKMSIKNKDLGFIPCHCDPRSLFVLRVMSAVRHSRHPLSLCQLHHTVSSSSLITLTYSISTVYPLTFTLHSL
jgi:hypothetical protein